MQLGDWLLPRTGLLGRDGRAFVAALCGRPTGVPSGSKDLQDELSANVLSDDSVAMQRCGEWTLVMQWGPPANIFWVPSLRVSDL